jgi:hypothetical protein
LFEEAEPIKEADPVKDPELTPVEVAAQQKEKEI